MRGVLTAVLAAVLAVGATAARGQGDAPKTPATSTATTIPDTAPAPIDAPATPANPPPDRKVISPAQAVILGLVEGITEYLPVSSTGHLVLTDEMLGLRDKATLTEPELDAVEAYEIVIQAGAILAVLFLYSSRVRLMVLGLMGRSTEGLRLFINVCAAFVPTAVVGLLLHKIIKQYLQSTGPVIFALAAGGLAMILFERSRRARTVRREGKTLAALTPQMAFGIGLLQCVAMWPGTSRSMMTIVGGMLLGLQPVAAAEFSFILGLPTLLAATLLKVVKEGPVLVQHVGWASMLIGLAVAGVSAAIAVKGFIAYLNRKGMTPFGIYRILLAVVMVIVLGVKAGI